MVDDLKSQKSFMLNLNEALLKDLGLQHQISDSEITRDVEVVKRRTHAEGVSFLTKTLPKLGKALDKALLAEEFTPVSEFKHDTRTVYPRLFRRLWELVFEREGMLKVEASAAAIQSLRQVLYLFYKYDLPYQDLTVRLSMEEYEETDKNITSLNSEVDTIATIYYAQEVMNAIFITLESEFNPATLRPKNGPGAVAHGETPWQRYRPHRHYQCLEELVPYGSFFYFNDRHLFDHWDSYFDLPHRGESRDPAILLAVPKDSRGPRLISKEPQEFMAYQQALKRELYSHLERNRWTSGHVNFTDQTINGELALRASKDASLATLDLSAASDRLSCELVEVLFEDLPKLQGYILSTRTGRTKLPDGRVLKLRKFAGMGSALTFPVQSVCFFALLVGDLVRGGMPLREATRAVWVYGDDIICPNNYAPEAIKVLESVGLKVNTDKSCYSGHFRESCGVDAWMGVDITPVKIKTKWQARNPEFTTLQAWVAYSDELWLKGYWCISSLILETIESTLGKKLPRVTQDSPLLGPLVWTKSHAIAANKTHELWSDDLQCFTYRGLAAKSRKARLRPGWERLLNWAWNTPIDSPNKGSIEDQPFSTELFTVRHTVTKKHVVVAESAL